MSYVVRHKDGSSLVVLSDQEVNGDYGVTFTGRRVNSYGEIQQDNFLWLMENFASTSQPVNPVVGQTWYDKVNKVLKVCKNSPTVPGSSAEWVTLYQNTTTEGVAEIGNIFFDQRTQQLKVYSNTGWTVVGPSLPSNHLLVEVKADEQDPTKKWTTNSATAQVVATYQLPNDESNLFRGVGTIKATIVAKSINDPLSYCGMWELQSLFYTNGSDASIIETVNEIKRPHPATLAWDAVLSVSGDTISVTLSGSNPIDNTDNIVWTVNLEVIMNNG